jgi:hypothetical protein
LDYCWFFRERCYWLFLVISGYFLLFWNILDYYWCSGSDILDIFGFSGYFCLFWVISGSLCTVDVFVGDKGMEAVGSLERFRPKTMSGRSPPEGLPKAALRQQAAVARLSI